MGRLEPETMNRRNDFHRRFVQAPPLPAYGMAISGSIAALVRTEVLRKLLSRNRTAAIGAAVREHDAPDRTAQNFALLIGAAVPNISLDV